MSTHLAFPNEDHIFCGTISSNVALAHPVVSGVTGPSGVVLTASQVYGGIVNYSGASGDFLVLPAASGFTGQYFYAGQSFDCRFAFPNGVTGAMIFLDNSLDSSFEINSGAAYQIDSDVSRVLQCVITGVTGGVPTHIEGY